MGNAAQYLFCGLVALTLCVSPTTALAASRWEITSSSRVGLAWAGHPVGFAFLIHKGLQFAAFYDEDRNMMVAQRSLDSDQWQLARLPEKVGWDSHNSIVMTVDDDDHLHLSGNMHAVPLVYFRTSRPMDIMSFERAAMTGESERRVTYPHFFRGPAKELIFTYRDGGSGNGSQIYNVYDHRSCSWRRLLDKPLFDGEGQRNAYPNGPSLGPDGYYHMVWVWRETPDCSTNHDLSYARSRDLRLWESSTGTLLALPMTLQNSEIVDPVPVKEGLINTCARLGFDSRKRPIISYHKYDEAGNSQIYHARLDEGRWDIRRGTDWDFRWAFSGGGSIVKEVDFGALRTAGKGTLRLDLRTSVTKGTWLVDEDSLKMLRPAPDTDDGALPRTITEAASSFPGVEVRRAVTRSDEPDIQYVLRWETLGANRDKPRKKPWPEPGPLVVYRLKKR